MIITNQEFCDTLNKASERYGNQGVLMALQIMVVLEKMVKEGKISYSQKNGKTYYRYIKY